MANIEYKRDYINQISEHFQTVHKFYLALIDEGTTPKQRNCVNHAAEQLQHYEERCFKKVKAIFGAG